MKPSADSSYQQLFERAQPYLDTRCNDVHTAIAYEFAKRLLAFYPDADESVVLPAIILHDIGWKMVAETEQLTAFGPNMSNPGLRRLHETEGARLAGDILAGLGYERAIIDAVSAIIDGHDSREHALCLNDKLVKDADKLWRFTPAGLKIDIERFGARAEDYALWLATQIDSWLFTPEAREMARQCLAEARPTTTG